MASVTNEMTTDYDRCLRHAQRFGVECVLETFARRWLPGPKVVYGGDSFAYDFEAGLRNADQRERRQMVRRLRIELEAIDAGRKVGLRGFGRLPRRRRSADETLEAVRQLACEGLVVSAIADKLGVSDQTVRRCLTAGNGPANPHGYAVKSALNGKDGLAPAQSGSAQNPPAQLAFGV
jgi:transposase-like protein